MVQSATTVQCNFYCIYMAYLYMDVYWIKEINLFYYILFYSILFYSILFYSI
jgi:hypothetical protein